MLSLIIAVDPVGHRRRSRPLLQKKKSWKSNCRPLIVLLKEKDLLDDHANRILALLTTRNAVLVDLAKKTLIRLIHPNVDQDVLPKSKRKIVLCLQLCLHPLINGVRDVLPRSGHSKTNLSQLLP